MDNRHNTVARRCRAQTGGKVTLTFMKSIADVVRLLRDGLHGIFVVLTEGDENKGIDDGDPSSIPPPDQDGA